MSDPTTPVRLPKPFRTILHGTCLLNGKHPPGSQLAQECPVLRPARRRQERDSGAQNQGGGITLQAPASGPVKTDSDSVGSNTRIRDGGTAEPRLAEARRHLWKTNGFGGRPRVPLAEQQRKARERGRAYRRRQRSLTPAPAF